MVKQSVVLWFYMLQGRFDICWGILRCCRRGYQHRIRNRDSQGAHSPCNSHDTASYKSAENSSFYGEHG